MANIGDGGMQDAPVFELLVGQQIVRERFGAEGADRVQSSPIDTVAPKPTFSLLTPTSGTPGLWAWNVDILLQKKKRPKKILPAPLLGRLPAPAGSRLRR